MREGRASRTAEHMALFRALESARGPGRRLFADPYAAAFLGWPLALVARAARLPGVAPRVARFIDQRWPGARSSGVARTRFIDDALTAALADGVGQVVLLGAGFDARAHRLPGIERARVFEVDHPATQARKRALLAGVLPAASERVRWVATDFSRGRLAEAMAAGGWDPDARTFFVWEGVTNYLTEDAVSDTLRWCARAAPGSRVLFTYVHRGVLDDPTAFVGTERLFATLAAVGERWTFGLEPAAVAGFLAARGLVLEEDVGAAEYRARYLGEAARALRGYEFYRIAVARVAGR
jgi:methyltransferase (TIGR00027 family)